MSVSDHDKGDLVEVGRLFAEAGFEIVATAGTKAMLEEAGIPARKVLKVQEGRPNLVDLILNNEVALVLNTPSLSTESAQDDSYIRKAAIKAHVPYMTTMAAAKATALGIAEVKKNGASGVRSLQEYHASIA